MKFGPFVLKPGALNVSGYADIEEWERHAQSVIAISRYANWWIGDLVNHGESRFADDFWQCVGDTVSLSQLERCARVARAYPESDRFPDLSWTHHQKAMSLEPKLRKAVLTQALKHKWDTSDLERYIKELSREVTVEQLYGPAEGSVGSAD